MDFGLTQEQHLLREGVRTMLDPIATPDYVRRCDSESRYPYELYEAFVGIGLFRLPFPELVGGFGGSLIDFVTVAEGVAQGAYEVARSYSMERQQFGRPICEVQRIQWKVADTATQIHAARLMGYPAATHRVDGFPDPFEDAYAKLHANEMVQRVTSEAFQSHGHYGYTREFPLERMVRGSRACALSGGKTESPGNTIASMVYGHGFDQRKG